MEKAQRKLFLVRLLIGLVLFSNLYAALPFFFDPQAYMAGYELAGESGKAAVAGFGLLFMIWQVPYISTLIHPVRNKLSFIESLAMQTMALLGETLILFRLPAANQLLRGSIQRFIVFDLAGLLVLALAFYLAHGKNQKLRTHEI